MADDKTTKMPEQLVTDTGPGKENPPEPEKTPTPPEAEKKTEQQAKSPQVSVYDFAEIMRINEGGVFAPGGYVAADPVGFKEHYHGTQDIPPEHRVFAYPEKAEPVHSILGALKRFQEASPVPQKDKAGPSHEER